MELNIIDPTNKGNNPKSPKNIIREICEEFGALRDIIDEYLLFIKVISIQGTTYIDLNDEDTISALLGLLQLVKLFDPIRAIKIEVMMSEAKEKITNRG